MKKLYRSAENQVLGGDFYYASYRNCTNGAFVPFVGYSDPKTNSSFLARWYTCDRECG